MNFRKESFVKPVKLAPRKWTYEIWMRCFHDDRLAAVSQCRSTPLTFSTRKRAVAAGEMDQVLFQVQIEMCKVLIPLLDRKTITFQEYSNLENSLDTASFSIICKAFSNNSSVEGRQP